MEWPPQPGSGPAADANRLLPFLPVPRATWGWGLPSAPGQIERSQISRVSRSDLSVFSLYPVSVDYWSNRRPASWRTTLLFAQGETVKKITPSSASLPSDKVVWVKLQTPVNAEMTGLQRIDILGETKTVLVEKGSNGPDNRNREGLRHGVEAKTS